MNKILSWMKRHWDILLLLLISLGIRIYIFKIMHPIIHTDSISYLFLGELDSVRTPGYPLFLEIFYSINDLFSLTINYFGFICFIQIFLLGTLNAFLIYKISRILTSNKTFSLLMGLLYNFNFFVVSFEFQILTETLSITLLLLSLVLFLNLFKAKKWIAIFGGIIFVLLIYTKPTFMLLGFCMPIITFIVFFPLSKSKRFFKRIAPVMAIFLIVNILGVGAWSLRNQIKYNYFGLSSLMPFNLRWYTNPIIEKFNPTKDEKLNRIAAVYAEEYRKTASSSVTFYNFHKRIQDEMNMTDEEISRAFLKINLHLIKDYPGEYLKQVPTSMSDYYKQYSFYWASGNTRKIIMKNNPISKVFRFFFRWHKTLFLSNVSLILMLVFAPVLIFIFTFRKKRIFHGWFILFTIVHYNCFISVFSTKAGVNNLRYRSPVEPLILLIMYAGLFYLGNWIYRTIKKRIKP